MPDFTIENETKGIIVGIDEAGRGPWAGPVVAGAVIIKNHNLPEFLLQGLDDSKKISATKREKLYQALFQAQEDGLLLIGIGEASAQEIDELNILQATFLAMKRAVLSLPISPENAIIDGNQIPKNFPCQCQCIIKGDARSYSISAASIIAKVYRDNLMSDLAQKYPYYGFEKNAGYGTAQHQKGLSEFGICPEHRLSYRPIQAFKSITCPSVISKNN